MRFAYADPPYLGCAHFYAAHHPEAMKWNDPETHRQLIERLGDEYPDGWAMHAVTPNLPVLMPMLPPHRLCAWVKPFASFKLGVGVAYAWEPVILVGGRRRTPRAQRTVRDWFACDITLRRGLVGAKPPPVIHWILDLLNVQRGDQVDDLFPGTGVVGRCIEPRVSGRATLDDLPLGLSAA